MGEAESARCFLHLHPHAEFQASDFIAEKSDTLGFL
jgi:hypothetical protein